MLNYHSVSYITRIKKNLTRVSSHECNCVHAAESFRSPEFEKIINYVRKVTSHYTDRNLYRRNDNYMSEKSSAVILFREYK